MAVADINVDALETFAKELCGTYGEGNVLAVPTDVGKLEQVVRLRERVYEAWGEVRVVRRDSRPSPACPRKEREGGIHPAVALSHTQTPYSVFRSLCCSTMPALP